MPCRDDYGPSVNDTVVDNSTYNDLQTASAGLCALLSQFESDDPITLNYYLSNIDWKEAGITEKQFKSWWLKHKMLDAQRRERERLERERVATNALNRRSGLAKLTAAERKALGL